MASRDMPQTMHSGRVVVVGDAAHPMHPTHGAGTGIGFEDAAVLGVLMGKEVGKEKVEDRLKVYNELRFERSAVVKYASEITGDPTKITGARAKLNSYLPGRDFPSDIWRYLWTADVVAEAEKRLRGLH
jgi:salicylate hydroxylase